MGIEEAHTAARESQTHIVAAIAALGPVMEHSIYIDTAAGLEQAGLTAEKAYKGLGGALRDADDNAEKIIGNAEKIAEILGRQVPSEAEPIRAKFKAAKKVAVNTAAHGIGTAFDIVDGSGGIGSLLEGFKNLPDRLPEIASGPNYSLRRAEEENRRFLDEL